MCDEISFAPKLSMQDLSKMMRPDADMESLESAISAL